MGFAAGLRRRGAATLVVGLALGLPACDGDSDEGSEPSTAPPTTAITGPDAVTVPGESPPPAPVAIADARAAVARYCRGVADYLAGLRGPPSAQEFERVSSAIDRLAASAAADPEATAPDGTTPRLALGDLAENLEGTNCDPRLVEHIDAALVGLPPG